MTGENPLALKVIEADVQLDRLAVGHGSAVDVQGKGDAIPGNEQGVFGDVARIPVAVTVVLDQQQRDIEEGLWLAKCCRDGHIPPQWYHLRGDRMLAGGLACRVDCFQVQVQCVHLRQVVDRQRLHMAGEHIVLQGAHGTARLQDELRDVREALAIQHHAKGDGGAGALGAVQRECSLSFPNPCGDGHRTAWSAFGQ
ncbi:hypothetical protein D3C71_1365860 [compost metagenome]